jgi:hypothetical protein
MDLLPSFGWKNTLKSAIWKVLKVVSSCKNSHKWHIIACSHKIDGYNIHDFYKMFRVS